MKKTTSTRTKKRKKIGVALSGGGARAFCYYGALEALADNGYEVDYLSAHSGAAQLLCYIFNGWSREKVISTYAKYSILPFVSPRAWFSGGFTSTRRIINYFQKLTNRTSLEQLPIPTVIHAIDITDPYEPQKVSIKNGDLATAAAISSRVPLLNTFDLQPDGKIIVDGGFISMYSAQELRDRGADIVIGMYPHGFHHTKLFKPFKNLTRVIVSLNAARNRTELEKEPLDLEVAHFPVNAGYNQYHLAQEMFEAGYARMLELLPELDKLVQS